MASRRGLVVPSLLADVRVEEPADEPVLAEAADVAERTGAGDAEDAAAGATGSAEVPVGTSGGADGSRGNRDTGPPDVDDSGADTVEVRS